MTAFKVGDRVTIDAPESIWDQKEGTIKALPEDDSDEFTVKVTFKKDDDVTKYVTQTFPENQLKQYVKSEALTEKMERNRRDYIADYLQKTDIDGEISSSWFFVDTLNVVENRTVESIITDAKKFGYKVFEIMAYDYDKFVVASKDYTVEKLYDEYGDFLLGPAAIREV